MGEDFDHSTNNEFDNLDQQWAYNQLQERINAFMNCQRRYQRQSVAVWVVTLNYDECDTPTRNCDAPVKEKATWVGQWRENVQFLCSKTISVHLSPCWNERLFCRSVRMRNERDEKTPTAHTLVEWKNSSSYMIKALLPSKNRLFRKKYRNGVFILVRCSKVSSFRIYITF